MWMGGVSERCTPRNSPAALSPGSSSPASHLTGWALPCFCWVRRDARGNGSSGPAPFMALMGRDCDALAGRDAALPGRDAALPGRATSEEPGEDEQGAAEGAAEEAAPGKRKVE